MTEDLKEKWGPIKSQPIEDLKTVAKDIYNGLIYTDRHCAPGDLMSRFMILMFMGPKAPTKPQYPSDNKDLQGSRDNIIYDLVDRDADQIKYEEEMKSLEIEQKYYNEQRVPSIGLIYEYLSEAGPLSINGGPVFMSVRMLNKDDASKVFEYYETYKEIREKADNF